MVRQQPYGRLSYTFADDPKIDALSPFAECLFFRLVALSGRNKWGGHIPESAVKSALPAHKRGKKSPESLLNELLNAPLVIRDDAGIYIPSFPQWNPYGMPSSERKNLSTTRVQKKRRRDKAPHETRFTGTDEVQRNALEERRGEEKRGEDNTPTPTASAVSEPQEAKPKRAPSSDAQRFWELYADAFFVDCGSRPTAQAHYFVQINRLLKQHSMETLAERLKNYFLSPTWIGKGGSRDFGRFVKFIDSWALPDTETADETVDRLFVKAPERAQAVLANGHTNLLTGGDQK